LQRAHSTCVITKKCKIDDPIVHNFTRFLSKNIEHTFGLSWRNYGIWLRTGYNNTVFHTALRNGNKAFSLYETSWLENWHLGLDAARNAVPESHPLSILIQNEMAELLKPNRPDPLNQGFHKVDDPTYISDVSGWLDLGFDTRGAIVLLRDTRNSNEDWANATHPLALIRYQTLTDSDFLPFRNAYLRKGSGGEKEYGKPNVTCCSQLISPRLINVWKKNSSSSVIVLTQMSFNESLHLDYGAPQELWLRINISNQQLGVINLSIILLNKSATRLPETMYFSMNPMPESDQIMGEWLMDKMNEWVSPLDVADGASHGVHGISSGLSFTRSTGKNIFFGTPDTALVRWGNPMPTPMPLIGPPELSNGASFPIFANVYWNTNYPFWMPFGHNILQKDYAWRFTIDLGSE